MILKFDLNFDLRNRKQINSLLVELLVFYLKISREIFTLIRLVGP